MSIYFLDLRSAKCLFYEGLPEMIPILRPGEIDLKDGPLFAALQAKTQAKEVEIPICWNTRM
uniref:Uncharacterized protein n=1 Tax=Cucumis sativus TaxID=3659 RepID=A0A0A0LI35_CUCSA